MKDSKMISAALNALETCLEITSEDRVLVLTDSESDNVSSAFTEACKIKGCAVDIFTLQSGSRPLKSVPPELNDLLKGKTVVLNIIKAFPDEIPFRIEWILKVEKCKNIRTAHMPGITENMMTGGPVDVDYSLMKEKAEELLALLRNAVSLHITTPAGTNLTLGVEGRKFLHDLHIGPGEIQNIPCGEVYCAPEEDKANGTLVIDASGGDLGLISRPLIIKIKNGVIEKFESEDRELVKTIEALTGRDIESNTIGELGIGVNPGAKIKGNMLEDEKATGTAHIAFGNNEDMPGGRNRAPIHRDLLFNLPTIKAYYTDGSERIIMENGVVKRQQDK